MVHVGGSACLIGGGGITLGDYSGISPGVKIFTTSESLDGEWMIHPTVPEKYRRPTVKPVSIGAHCTIGANSVLLPGAILHDGACLGALSLTKGQLGEWSIWAGVPARFIRTRGRRSIELARELEQQ